MRIAFRWFLAFLTAMLLLVFLLKGGIFLSSPMGKPQRADAIVILGGDEGRSFPGLDLYRKRFAPVVLLTGMEREVYAQKYYLTLQARILITGGVRKDAIEFEAASKSSWQEAVNTLKLAKIRGWRKVIVISDPPHMRRLKWTWGKVLKGSGVDFVLVSGEPSWWCAEKWWRNEYSFQYVVTEYIKLLYYFVRH